MGEGKGSYRTAAALAMSRAMQRIGAKYRDYDLGDRGIELEAPRPRSGEAGTVRAAAG